MIRISRVIGLAALLASCRPDVRDCQIRCAADTELCPDGFSCLEGMCRAEGAEGVCGAADGDGGTSDGDGGATPTSLTIETANGVTPGALPFLAVQDGDAPWQALTGAGPHVIELETGRY